MVNGVKRQEIIIFSVAMRLQTNFLVEISSCILFNDVNKRVCCSCVFPLFFSSSFLFGNRWIFFLLKIHKRIDSIFDRVFFLSFSVIAKRGRFLGRKKRIKIWFVSLQSSCHLLNILHVANLIDTKFAI